MNLRKGEIKSQYSTVNGMQIHARVSEDILYGEDPVIVLMQGLVVSSRYMASLAEVLAPHYRVLAPDFPGFGKSEKPDQIFDLPALAEFLTQWMDEQGIGQAVMLGNSFGCQIIAEFAVRYPERLERAIQNGPTIDPHARTFPQQLWRWLMDAPLEPTSPSGTGRREIDVSTLPIHNYKTIRRLSD